MDAPTVPAVGSTSLHEAQAMPRTCRHRTGSGAGYASAAFRHASSAGILEGLGMKTEIYDYIVVGAGSAGCVVGKRVSADPSVGVCVMEGGGWGTSRG